MTTAAANNDHPITELPLWEANLPVLAPKGPRAGGMDTFDRDQPLEPHHAPGEVSEASADLQGQAQELLAEANREAGRILEEARARATELAEEATTRALAETATRQTEAFTRALDLIRDDLSARFREAVHDLEVEAARLCAALAESVVLRRIEQDDQVVVEVAREGLARMVGAKEITIRVSPEGQAALEAARDTLALSLPSSVAITILPDPAVKPGGTVLQSANGEIDLQVETQIARLSEAAEAALLRETTPEVEP